MATSGNVTSNSAGATYPNPNNLYFEWWQTGRDVGGNWTDIQFNLKASGGADGWWTYYNNIQLNVDGQAWSNGRVQAYNGQVLISGSKRLYHDSAGNKSFGVSASAGIYTTSTNVWLSGSWSLDNIPRHATIGNTSGNISDEGTPWVEFSNPANAAVNVWLEIIEPNGTISEHIAQRNNVRSRYTWSLSTAERNTLRSKLSTTTSKTLRYVVYDNVGGIENWSTKDYKLTIVNANPTFSSFTYKDTNSISTGLTGNNQVLIQGVSNLQVTIPSANKAVAKKQATIKNYTATISGLSRTANYSSSSDVVISGFGNNFTGGNQILSVKATDSRNLTATVSKTVQVLSYAKPEINATATRKNNFENDTTLHVEGSYSQLLMSNVAKNAIQSVKYRTKKQSTSTWGGWVAMENLTNSAGKFSVDDDILNLDNNSAWDVQIQVVDKLNTVAVSLTVSVGIPIFRIGSKDNFVYNNEQPLMPSHVGMILLTTGLATVAAVQKIYGGTWEVFGKGKTLVGVDPNDTDFKTVNKSGGTKTVTLTANQMPKHDHQTIPWVAQDMGREVTGTYAMLSDGRGNVASGSAVKVTTAGNSEAHNNLQPYITVYMYRRTA